MYILVLNSGSSSVKYLVIKMPDEKIMLKGKAEKSGLNEMKFLQERSDGIRKQIDSPEFSYEHAFDYIFKYLTDNDVGAINSVNELDAVAHRLVHGGEGIDEAVEITPELIDGMKEKVQLAPLHYPANLAGIAAVSRRMPAVFQAGVFDTAFHQSIPPEAFHYAIPYKYYQKYRIRRYGFHGSNHKYVSQKACEISGLDFSDSRIITCHLGNGTSLAAIKDGKSMDTSMGYTPVEGLIMGSRSGDIDAGILFFIMREENLTPSEMEKILNKESGLLGLSDFSGDIRDLLSEAESGNRQAKLAIEAYVYRIKKYIGAYSAILGGLDILVFTGGIGENSAVIREKICKGLEYLGIGLDISENMLLRENAVLINSVGSNVKIAVVAAGEELAIARETMKLYQMKH